MWKDSNITDRSPTSAELAIGGPRRHYRVYGLRVRSEIAFPELTSCKADEGADIDVRLGSVQGPLPETGVPRLTRIGKDDAYLAWPHIGRFLVTRSGRVTIDTLTEDERFVRYALLGPVFAAALQLRGVPLLHGSAVAAGGTAILFVGPKGAGKSTTAAAFAAEGCVILNDDVLPLTAKRRVIAVVPGFPGLKLAPAMKLALLDDYPVLGAELARPLEKVFAIGQTAGSVARPVGMVVILDGSELSGPTHLSPALALPELLKEGYALKFGGDGLGNGQAEALFDACSRLAREAIVIRVGRHSDPRELRAFAQDAIIALAG